MQKTIPFRKRDLIRACLALEAAGLAVARVEIGQNGTLVIVPAEPAAAFEAPATGGEAP